jgi:hypothetical protein
MHETLREFSELVGRCLAWRWLRERETLKRAEDTPDTPDSSSDPASTGPPEDDDVTPSNAAPNDDRPAGCREIPRF